MVLILIEITLNFVGGDVSSVYHMFRSECKGTLPVRLGSYMCIPTVLRDRGIEIQAGFELTGNKYDSLKTSLTDDRISKPSFQSSLPVVI